jgi:hypothetical protein
MTRIKSRRGFCYQKLAAAALVAVGLAVRCSTPARAQGATEGDVTLPSSRIFVGD